MTWFLASYWRRLKILATDYGRDAGWVIERQSQPIAVLSDRRYEEMFWDSYKMEVVTDDPMLRKQVWTKEFWDRAVSEGLIWRNREFNEVAPNAFPAGSPFPQPGRLMVRGLYLMRTAPWPWECLLLRWIRPKSSVVNQYNNQRKLEATNQTPMKHG